ncbi:hypothetical protein Rsub_12099 [Raphidocelis subcapitata]|uniref:Uncharacterized protein n=1 Tax=Raphidocelis subcapitata TaxID=307507 RepID=A0A2V0PHM2_9CHLO|nr:hypothetical protein Rsub_12099 [Raphidocelis subcapitata]|eukprot:GBF99318.1 hypothetical protein Rsub_12099 [Raphidocelis subcapitata]
MSAAMDADAPHDQARAQQHATQLSKEMAVAHVCDHRCRVQHMFGNAFRCESSGQLHVCDANCVQRVYRDRYSSVCRISRRVFPNAFVEQLPCRKRGGGGDGGDACRKRGPGAGAACADAPVFGFAAPCPPAHGDSMVM